MPKPSIYLTLTPGYPEGEAMFKMWSHWATVREELRPYNLVCVPLKKIPRRAPLVLFRDLHPTPKTLDFIRKRSPDTLHLFQYEPATYLPYQYTSDCYEHFSQIYTVRDNLHDPKFRKYHHPHSLKSYTGTPQRLLTMVVGCKASSYPTELYTERRRLIEFFEKLPDADFTFYGQFGWEHLGYRNYGGTLDDKLATISNFRFTIAYENCCGSDGYVTEKILDCLFAGSVPIYWGAPNITDYVPADCFIDRTRFSSNQALYDYLLTADTAPYLEAAQRYLASGKIQQLFSEERFARDIASYLSETLSQK